MTHSFDLISDLFLTPDSVFNWKHQPTSIFCIVAGNISADRTVLISTLTHLSECYKAVFYIDGYLEHLHCMDYVDESYADLEEQLATIPNLTYLQNQVVVADGMAILGTNGWWSHDFNADLDYCSSTQYTREMLACNESVIDAIQLLALNDYNYITQSVAKLQRFPDVKKILVVSNTVPHSALLVHDPDFQNNYRTNTLGNSYLRGALVEDTEKKIHTWCHGTYGKNNTVIDSVQYISNAREKEGSKLHQATYYPSRVNIL